MKTVELCLGRYDREWTIYNVISVEFEISPKVHSSEELARFLRSHGGFFVNIRYWDQPYGKAADAFAEVLQLFDRIRSEFGPAHLDYAFLPREEVVLDFTTCTDASALYREMREKMEWEAWYGENLDALWDILTGLPYKGDDFVILRPEHFCVSPWDEFLTNKMDQICDVFLEAQAEYGEISVDIRFADSPAGQGAEKSC